jgi:hypothetical protein
MPFISEVNLFPVPITDRPPGFGQISAQVSWAGDGVEGLAEIVGEGVGGGDGARAGLDLDGAVAAGGADELAD